MFKKIINVPRTTIRIQYGSYTQYLTHNQPIRTLKAIHITRPILRAFPFKNGTNLIFIPNTKPNRIKISHILNSHLVF